MLVLLALIIFAGLLIYAAASDVVSYTIPNWLSIATFAAFPVLALAMGVPLMNIGWHIAFGLAILVAGFFLFQANIFGGGDAKLFAAASVWTGSVVFLPFLIWTALAGGVMGLSLLAARRFVPQSETNPAFVNHLLKEQNGIPYGVAMMAGGLMTLPTLLQYFNALTLP